MSIITVKDSSLVKKTSLKKSEVQVSETFTQLDWVDSIGLHDVLEITFDTENVPESLITSVLLGMDDTFGASNTGCTLDWYGIPYRAKITQKVLCSACKKPVKAKKFTAFEHIAVCNTCWKKALRMAKIEIDENDDKDDIAWKKRRQAEKNVVSRLGENVKCLYCNERPGTDIGPHSYFLCNPCAVKSHEDEDRYNSMLESELSYYHRESFIDSIREHYASRLETYDPNWDRYAD